MGGHVLFLPSDYMRIGEEIVHLYQKKAQVSELIDKLKVFEKRGEQKKLIKMVHQLFKKRMTKEEIAYYFDLEFHQVEEILALDPEEDYDFAYIDGFNTERIT